MRDEIIKYGFNNINTIDSSIPLSPEEELEERRQRKARLASERKRKVSERYEREKAKAEALLVEEKNKKAELESGSDVKTSDDLLGGA